MHTILNIILILIGIGVLLGAVNKFLPIEATIKNIINGVVIIAVIIWLLQVFDILKI